MSISDEFLIGVASIATALIGFSGVVTALGRRGEGRWTPSEILQLKTLVEPSIVSLLGAFAPIVLGLAILNSEVLWRVSNALLLSFHMVGFTAFLVRGNRSGVEPSHKVMTAIFLLIAALQIGSILDFIPYHQLAFSLSLIYGVFVSVHNFYLLLFYSGKKSTEKGA
ncbi:MAG: hypothetical protein ABJ056_14245 [Halioglobus sp.]